MKALGFLLLIIIVLIVAVKAEAAPRQSPRAQAIANDFRAGGPTVWCIDDQAEWDSRPNWAGKSGVTMILTREVFLSPLVCKAVEQQNLLTANDGYPIQVFVHELIHSVGVDNEGQAECLALGAHYQFVRQYYGANHLLALLSHQRAWAYHNQLPPEYRPVWCRAPQPEFYALPVAPAIHTVKVVKKCFVRNSKKRLVPIRCPR